MKIRNFKGYAALVALSTMVALHAPITVQAEDDEEVLYVEEEDNYTESDAGTPTEAPVTTTVTTESTPAPTPQVTIDASNWDSNDRVESIPDSVATELDRKGLTPTPTPSTPSTPGTPTPTPSVPTTPTPTPTPSAPGTPTPTPNVPKLGDKNKVSGTASFLAGFGLVSCGFLVGYGINAFRKQDEEENKKSK